MGQIQSRPGRTSCSREAPAKTQAHVHIVNTRGWHRCIYLKYPTYIAQKANDTHPDAKTLDEDYGLQAARPPKRPSRNYTTSNLNNLWLSRHEKIVNSLLTIVPKGGFLLKCHVYVKYNLRRVLRSNSTVFCCKKEDVCFFSR